MERDVVDRQSGSGVAGGTGGDGDAPRQIEAGVSRERDRKRVADAGSSSRDGGVAVVVGVGSERGLEFVAGGGPVNAVNRGVELNGEAGGIGSVAVFLDVVAEGYLLEQACGVVIEARHEIDSSCAIRDTGGQSPHCTVVGSGSSEVPGAIVGIACQGLTSDVHRSLSRVGVRS